MSLFKYVTFFYLLQALKLPPHTHTHNIIEDINNILKVNL